MSEETDSELTRAKWLLGALALFLLSGCISYEELVYLTMSRRTLAEVTDVGVASAGTRRSDGKVLIVKYTFTEKDGTVREGGDQVPLDWLSPEDGKVPVQYTAGATGRSRIAGRVHWLGLTFFAFSIVVVGVFGYQLFREAREATRPRTGKGRG